MNGMEEVYIACTEGGEARLGQIWKYRPSSAEGTPQEKNSPATLELFVEADSGTILENGDNLTVSPWGDLIVCEDGTGDDYLLGITPAGEVYESGNFKEVLSQTLELMDWNGFPARRARSEKRGFLRGQGLACYIEWTGGDLSETVRIEAKSDGMITLYSGTQNMGQGLETVFTQLLSEKLQIPMESTKIVLGDTKLVKGL